MKGSCSKPPPDRTLSKRGSWFNIFTFCRRCHDPLLLSRSCNTHFQLARVVLVFFCGACLAPTVSHCILGVLIACERRLAFSDCVLCVFRSGRHEHFFDEVDDFKCPECDAPREAFFDANDPNDPHNQVHHHISPHTSCTTQHLEAGTAYRIACSCRVWIVVVLHAVFGSNGGDVVRVGGVCRITGE